MFTVCRGSESPVSPNSVQSMMCLRAQPVPPVPPMWVTVGGQLRSPPCPHLRLCHVLLCVPVAPRSGRGHRCWSAMVWRGVKHLLPLVRSSVPRVLSTGKSLCSGPRDSPGEAEGCRCFSLWKGEFRGPWVTHGALASGQSTGWAPGEAEI